MQRTALIVVQDAAHRRTVVQDHFPGVRSLRHGIRWPCGPLQDRRAGTDGDTAGDGLLLPEPAPRGSATASDSAGRPRRMPRPAPRPARPGSDLPATAPAESTRGAGTIDGGRARPPRRPAAALRRPGADAGRLRPSGPVIPRVRWLASPGPWHASAPWRGCPAPTPAGPDPAGSGCDNSGAGRPEIPPQCRSERLLLVRHPSPHRLTQTRGPLPRLGQQPPHLSRRTGDQRFRKPHPLAAQFPHHIQRLMPLLRLQAIDAQHQALDLAVLVRQPLRVLLSGR